jgi:hypothetical protein
MTRKSTKGQRRNAKLALAVTARNVCGATAPDDDEYGKFFDPN